MKTSPLEQIVDAVLYEGHILYPYRASAIKNQRRFTFGRVYPRIYSEAQDGLEPYVMQTQCLLRVTPGAPPLEVSVRFLHPMAREVKVLRADGGTKVVPELRVDDHVFQTWQEAVEREFKCPPVAASVKARLTFPLNIPSSQIEEPITNRQQQTVGMLIRRQESLAGSVEVAVEPVDERVSMITVRIQNQTQMPPIELENQDAVIMRTFASTHTILCALGNEFLSLMDPPAAYKQAAADCKNIGTWPVLVGYEADGERDTMLSSPIILSDFPQIAPESSGTFFDGTEIDEMLSLRIMTMTEEEKREMRHADEQARHLLERTEAMRGEDLLKMHGALRDMRSFDEQIFGTNTRLEKVSVGEVCLHAGDQVRIRPKVRADVMDIALAGKTAVIEALEQDAEGQIHLALVLSDDPGKDLGLLRQPGHRFFYGLDEVEPL